MTHSNTIIQNLFISPPPCNHKSCLISSFRGLRNGIYYGGKVRLVHAIVMTLLFKKGTIMHRIKHILQLTYEHAKNLGLYVFLYKSLVCILNRIRQKQSKFHNFISGFICGSYIFGEKTSINQQIVLYLLSRVLYGGAQSLSKKGYLPQWKFYRILATICWGIVMFLFEDDSSTLQSSLTSSMEFLYKESDKKIYYWTQLLPFNVNHRKWSKFFGLRQIF
ncbi:hypothetical protein IMG5_196010 [Ichthyophthirius multifiliis]|uniref:Peroxisomal membrane protein 4 n=1 Tax=Ichthyophthirius multifiliis TaxID=5932 RepID=G0R517_ICHMU|nr:hypothetical protein IMG5_196010 [Ichthyophthirius multifiliis]EGR27419.1 hypothetical protein IMG5_196010 [Ichthyophthirius multifiliis]|eukprot:XP_004024329.1 hypothetical protein IMG5_196010 [Ichthyophthirius multifiliis]